jgi:hypothetical protein
MILDDLPTVTNKLRSVPDKLRKDSAKRLGGKEGWVRRTEPLNRALKPIIASWRVLSSPLRGMLNRPEGSLGRVRAGEEEIHRL